MSDISRKILTIAIPTFNRLQPLLHTLEQLNKQPQVSSCEILIVDNASDYAPKELSDNFSRFENLHIRLERNRGNIGLSGNLLRCMELAHEEWVWVLADDDDLSENAVSVILSRLSTAESLDFILFSQKPGQRGGIQCDNVREFAQTLDSWDRICFISDGIYRTERACEMLNIGILYGYSVIPFLAMILIGLQEKKWRVAFEREILVSPAHRAVSSWSMVWSTHTIVVAELVEDQVARHALKGLAKTWCVGPIGLTHDHLKRAESGQAGNSKEAFFHRLFMASRCSPKYFLMAIACFAVSSLPHRSALKFLEILRNLAGKTARNSRSGEEVFSQT